MAKAPAIGIDLGTTYSCVGVYQLGNVEIIANDQGNKTTPSYVAFTDIENLIGDPARDQANRNLNNTIFDAKRMMGRNFDDAVIQADMKKWPFEVINEDKRPKIKVEVKGVVETYFPEEISSMILSKMKETAEAYLGQTVTNAVITVPAYFNDSQRQATKDAAAIARLNVLRLINEPTAAAIAYGLQKKVTDQRNVLIFDLGGGTFDVTILTIKNGVFKVKSTAGDTHLGGQDFDNMMINHFAEEFKRKYKKDITQDKRAIRRLRTACERAKRTLSSATSASIEVEPLYDGIDFYSTISRARFEELNADLFRCALKQVRQAICDAGMNTSQIDDIVLVGGSSRIPKVQKLLQDYFGGKELIKSINPDEAVAYGAAIQAAILNGDKSDQIKDVLLLDVTPLSLGLGTNYDCNEMFVVIKRNTTIPIKQTVNGFSTLCDNQTAVTFPVFEGESAITKNNNSLGKFSINVYPAPRGTPKLDVTFEIDANGILNVCAKDRMTGNEGNCTFAYNKNRLSEKEIERIINAAKVENKKRKSIASISESPFLCYKIISTLEEGKLNGEMSQSERNVILNECNETIRLLTYDKISEQEKLKKHEEFEILFNLIVAITTDNVEERNSKYCEILNVEKRASASEVEDAHRQRALKYHPDRFEGNKDFGKWIWLAITKAEVALSSQIKRRKVRNH